MIIRALEETDLEFVHQLNNEYSIMSYWFEEPYQSLSELQHLYNKHILDEDERRFIIEQDDHAIGIVELVEIDFVHRNCEVQIIVDPDYSGHGFAKQAFKMAIDYAFLVLNMHKVYLYVDVNNEKAVHIYETHNFNIEGTLKEHFYTNGEYRDCYVMGLLKNQWSYSNPDNLSHIR
ncbi:GNAT family N-acetyltransferase [Staphylococcus lugdunensis]|jgi:diamine N-acetyltransferase|uniref:GNAT family N-acetyltransferase n=1 Tax=Staphylococcus lugdunensis TaxID=28035 RepID=A0A292DGV0_STALU|nr:MULTISPECIES: GNAT family N-acetyltransferase [Staphylococcus]AMG61527.1 spermidine acetyltransferase [Staphylococcus lugdunensis]AMG64528.1 GNAT family N-acetyltransferase [Staphylococcus lugdunensis]ARB78628.1 GNAT family N-acetyltransferase [Staphylococcus lugdunensis]ARJ12349.1 spermidine acetyltransferase [Staphylococcus lugdunensis]ARJ14848.1 spermidine acetyltransferase [Staphylococcus lugdunensis]